MSEEQCKLTVFFEEPFWVGVFERIENGKLSAAKVTFGAEPKDYEVYEFVLKHYYDLRFSPAVAAVIKETKQNPKRIQRDIKKSLAKTGIGTKLHPKEFCKNQGLFRREKPARKVCSIFAKTQSNKGREKMNNDKKKALKEQYKNRHPQMGIVCWQCGDEMWVDMSKDAKSDFNSTDFQLKLGSWPNRSLQKAYKENPEEFKFSLIKELDYEDYSEDHTDDLKILLMDFLEEHPNAKPMRVKFNL